VGRELNHIGWRWTSTASYWTEFFSLQRVERILNGYNWMIGIVNMGFKDFFDDLVLSRGADGGNDLEGLTASRA